MAMGMGNKRSAMWCLVLGLLLVVVAANAEVEETAGVLPAAAEVVAPGNTGTWCRCHGARRPCAMCPGIGANSQAVSARGSTKEEDEEEGALIGTAAEAFAPRYRLGQRCRCSGVWIACERCRRIGAKIQAVIARGSTKGGRGEGAQIGTTSEVLASGICYCHGAYRHCIACLGIGTNSQVAIARGSTNEKEALIGTAAVEGQTKTTAWYDCENYCWEEEPNANHADCVHRCENAPRRQASSIAST